MLEIQKDSALSYGAVWNFIKKIEKAGYVAKEKGLYKLTNREILLSQAASLNPIRTKEKIEYPGRVLQRIGENSSKKPQMRIRGIMH